MPQHRVRQGECISSIADRYGLFWETIWNDPANAELKRKRRDPNVLLPGDVVEVPERKEKLEGGQTEQTHRFMVRGVPAKMKLRLLVNDRPRANEPYELCIDGRWERGTTDPDGYVEATIPPGAQEGKLLVGSEGSQDVYPLHFGTVDPIDSETGVRGRLRNLGYEVDEDLTDALRTFQGKEGLEVTGTVDQPTRQRLQEVFGE